MLKTTSQKYKLPYSSLRSRRRRTQQSQSLSNRGAVENTSKLTNRWFVKLRWEYSCVWRVFDIVLPRREPPLSCQTCAHILYKNSRRLPGGVGGVIFLWPRLLSASLSGALTWCVALLYFDSRLRTSFLFNNHLEFLLSISINQFKWTYYIYESLNNTNTSLTILKWSLKESYKKFLIN